MKILGCDLHAKQQTIAMVDTETGESCAGWVIRRGFGQPRPENRNLIGGMRG